jgi:hypothetical protein
MHIRTAANADASIAAGASMTYGIIRIEANVPTFQISGVRGEVATLALLGTRWWEPAHRAQLTVGSRVYKIEHKAGMFKRRFDWTDDQGATVEVSDKGWFCDVSIPIDGQQYRFRSSGWTGNMRVFDQNDNRIAEITPRLSFGPQKARASFTVGTVTTTHLLLALIAYYLVKIIESVG